MRSDFASKRGQKQSEYAVENMILKKLETIFGRRSAKTTEKKININFENLTTVSNSQLKKQNSTTKGIFTLKLRAKTNQFTPARS